MPRKSINSLRPFDNPQYRVPCISKVSAFQDRQSHKMELATDCGLRTMDIPMIGDRLGKWVIFKELGRGGMGHVYLAQEEIGGRQAALKILAAELAQDVGFLQRFQRGIETLSRLDHPHVRPSYEAGFDSHTDFYAMGNEEGQS